MQTPYTTDTLTAHRLRMGDVTQLTAKNILTITLITQVVPSHRERKTIFQNE